MMGPGAAAVDPLTAESTPTSAPAPAAPARGDSTSYFTMGREDMADFLAGTGSYGRALDIGCAAGLLGRSLVTRKICAACDGIEPHPQAAALAEGNLERVWAEPLEAAFQDVPWDRYDLVVMADVLEHMVEPWDTLARVHAAAAPGTRLAVSVPNIRHMGVLGPLLFKGRFEYVDAGILDRTHLHLFTRSSLMDTLRHTGWEPRHTQANLRRRYRKPWFPHRLLEGFLAIQYFVVAERRA